MEKLYLLCNAHLDPIWQWQLNEGIAAAISTFRTAAELCEEHEELVFNHNESLLYKWVEQYEPELFERIHNLIKKGRWHIIGGWTLQPDCQMLSGESFVRQILYGKNYFYEKFGVEPKVAVNFDSFGHTRGLVQILKKSGYKYYIFMRPDPSTEGFTDLPQIFQWKGFNNSEIIAYRLNTGYNTGFGNAAREIERYITENRDKRIAMRCWGVGDHGGGPSNKDVKDIKKLTEQYKDRVEIIHSAPEQYFNEIDSSQLPAVEKGLGPVFPGCYTSLIRIKQKHRSLEGKLTTAEKMAAAASLLKPGIYPYKELQQAFDALMLIQFHDVLAGTCTQQSEEEGIRIADYGLELAERICTQAFYTLLSGQHKADEGCIPIFIYNPQPYEITDIFTCEFMLAGQNWSNKTTIADVFYDGIQIPSQIIKEDSNISLDWRKKIAFCAKLKPMSMNRFDLRLNLSDYISQINLEYGDRYIFENEEIRVVLNMKTGLIDSYFADNMEHLKLGGCMLEVFEDVADSWLMHTNKLDTSAGCFRLMSPNEAREFAGVENINFKPVNIIEDGNVFVEIEALFRYNNSFSRISYRFPKTGREIAVSVTLYFQEKDKMVRLVIPTNMEDADFFGQTAFGIEKLDSTGVESISHRWLCASNQNHSLVLINNGVYGSSNKEGVIRQSLLRSSGYCVHPIENRSLFRQDRFLARADQGERSYQFWLCSQPESKWIAYAERASQIKNEPPYIVSAFPSGRGRVYNKLMEITETVRLDCFKRAKKGEGFIVHLFNPLSITQTATLRCPILDIHHIFDMEPYEVKCFLLSSKVIHEVDFLENPSV